MNKAFIGAGIALALTLSSCNSPLGIPTVGVVQVTNTVVTNTTTGKSDWNATYQPYTVKGSPAGQVVGFVLTDGTVFDVGMPVSVKACTDARCDGDKIVISKSYANNAAVPTLKVRAILVKSQSLTAGNNDIYPPFTLVEPN